MTKLSTGDDSTLGNYRKLLAPVLGEKSKAIEYLDRKIAESPWGADEKVFASERQMLDLLLNLE